MKYAFKLKEYTRFSVIKKKVGKKLLEDKELVDIKYYYLKLNFDYNLIQKEFLEVAECC